MSILDDKPTPPKLPFARATLREAIYDEPQVTPHTDADFGRMPNLQIKEVPVYTKEQLEAYGRQMQIYGLVIAQRICNEYDGGWYVYRKGAAECCRAIGLEILTTITPDGEPLPTTIRSNIIAPTTTKDRT